MRVKRWMLTLALASAGLLVCRDAAGIAVGNGIPSQRGLATASNYNADR